ncbi:hypothetical protein LSH36_569g00028 [Paralvinella palmiformis]|uniref:C-type lectin domain-containing protein n=1 Tax=Paralvinella palmiformis TaxID=53620 RepID=A0AAD9J618_9ANNE|nr:hypothetical protein LSH36_569g00028 [Paralvinella palmiformis]
MCHLILKSDTNTTDYWIGLFLMNETGEAEWTWIDGKPLSYKNWLDVEPNGSGECGRIAVNDTWRDTECSSTISHFKHDIYFLCKKENDDASGAASYVNMHATIIVLLLSLSLV